MISSRVPNEEMQALTINTEPGRPRCIPLADTVQVEPSCPLTSFDVPPGR